jgi:hypothetical protein
VGRRHASGGVDGSEQLLALPGRGHLTARVPGGKSHPSPRSSPPGELLGSGEQQLANAVQRIMRAAPVAQGDLLGAAADLVDHRVGQPDSMEVVHHGRMTQWGHQGAGIPPPRVQGDRADPGQPAPRPAPKPAVHRSPGTVGHHLQQPATLQVHQAGDPPSWCGAGGLQQAGLVQPEPGHPIQASRVLHQRPAVIGHRSHDGRPADPQITAGRGHRVGVLADPPADLGPARWVITITAPIAAVRSVQVRTHRLALDSATCACATTAPPAGHLRAGRAPGPCAGRDGLRLTLR